MELNTKLEKISGLFSFKGITFRCGKGNSNKSCLTINKLLSLHYCIRSGS